MIAENDKIIDKILFKRYFGYDSLSDMQADLYEARNISLSETKANLIEDKLDSSKKSAIDNMTTSKFSTKKPYKIVNTVSEIFKFNKKISRRTRIKNINSRTNA